MTRDKADILAAIEKIDSLPAFPDVMMRFQNEMASEHPDVQKLATIIEDDPSLTARFLKTVNSAFYARGQTVTSISQAIARLGLAETRRLAITTALVDRYRSLGGLMPQNFWTHSIAVALTTRAILKLGAHSFSTEEIELAYIAGLLHDIGIIVLFHLFENDYRQTHQNQLSTGGISLESEEAQFGIHHGEAGAALIKSWKLPQLLYEPVRHHHHPWLAAKDQRAICYLIHLSDFVCNNIGASRMETRIETNFDDTAFEMFGLTLEQVPDIVENVKEQAAAAESLVKLG
ncbi:MAG: HDOD domain-containing protein [Deltaproteobacteria bacterium]|nr:HDOD domain-containing protein [Deltaproteobacteria bacterium]